MDMPDILPFPCPRSAPNQEPLLPRLPKQNFRPRHSADCGYNGARDCMVWGSPKHHAPHPQAPLPHNQQLIMGMENSRRLPCIQSACEKLPVLIYQRLCNGGQIVLYECATAKLRVLTSCHGDALWVVLTSHVKHAAFTGWCRSKRYLGIPAATLWQECLHKWNMGAASGKLPARPLNHTKCAWLGKHYIRAQTNIAIIRPAIALQYSI